VERRWRGGGEVERWRVVEGRICVEEGERWRGRNNGGRWRGGEDVDR
jgi:hypothetical protein